MQLTLYMAPSLDGYIALPNGDSEWVSEECAAEFMNTINDYGCIIYGHHTYSQYHGELYPVSQVDNIILSHESNTSEPKTYFVSSPAQAVSKAKELGHDRVLLIGGGNTNGQFLAQHLIDDMILDYHPIILGSGIHIFGDSHIQVDTQLIAQSSLGKGIIHAKYQILKSL